MKEQKEDEKFPDLILTGDWHLREDTPICRKDNFWEAQWEKVDFISSLQKKYQCPILNGGDLFHHWKPSPYLLSSTMQHIPDQFYTIYGNHDLPNHALQEANKCGIYVLVQAGKAKLMEGCHWGQVPKETSFTLLKNNKNINILVYHIMTYKGALPFPGCTDIKARSLLYKYPNFKMILTSDNHQPFTQTYEDRLLVNPGSMMRQEAGQMEYKPAVWLWYADTNTVEPVYLPIEKGVVTREHIDEIEKKENRIVAFIETLNRKGMDYISFTKNLEVFLQKNKINKTVEEIIYEMIDEDPFKK
jgi:DNA repair exonuclease SbcCD nuclease subunit